MLMLPYTPLNKPNLTAWLAARCDLPQYGQLLVYRFPKGKQVAGPMQVENFISQEPEISQQISLWNTQGSRVLRGNLLILPRTIPCSMLNLSTYNLKMRKPLFLNCGESLSDTAMKSSGVRV